MFSFKNLFRRGGTGTNYSDYFGKSDYGYKLNVDGFVPNSLLTAYKRNCSTLSTVINRHIKDISAIEFGIDNKGEGYITPVSEIDEYKNMKLPALVSKLAGDADLNGNIYLEQIGNEYRRINPRDVSWEGLSTIKITRPYGIESTYKYNTFNERFETTQGGVQGILYHKKLFDSISGTTGQGESPVLPIQDDILMTVFTNMHNATYMQKGMKTDMLISFDERIPDAKYDKFKKDFIEKNTGLDNVGIPVIMSGAGKSRIDNLQGSVRDMDFEKLLTKSDKAILKVYDIPLPVFMEGSQTFNNYAEAEKNYYKNSVLPLMKFVIDFINEILETQFVINSTTIPVLKQEMIENSDKMAKAGIYSVNECREISGYGEIDGGDQVFRPSSEIPIGDESVIEEPMPKQEDEEIETDE